MDDNNKTLLYVGFKEKTSAKLNWWQRKIEMPVYQCQRKSWIQEGQLTVWYVTVPEFYYKTKYWKDEKLVNELQKILAGLRPDDFFLHPQVRKLLQQEQQEQQEQLPPVYLLEAMLCVREKQPHVSIILPDEPGAELEDLVIHLLTPYLHRVNQISVVGGGDRLFEELEDYFYEEYGILTLSAPKPARDSLCLNLRQCERETVKFLDTMVKNGYNTKVN